MGIEDAVDHQRDMIRLRKAVRRITPGVGMDIMVSYGKNPESGVGNGVVPGPV